MRLNERKTMAYDLFSLVHKVDRLEKYAKSGKFDLTSGELTFDLSEMVHMRIPEVGIFAH